MKDDPAITEIRKARQDISARFGHDTKALIDHYKELQKEYEDRLLVERDAVLAPSGAERDLPRHSS
jgi:hypothetical protein